jgi:hypothetical protein
VRIRGSNEELAGTDDGAIGGVPTATKITSTITVSVFVDELEPEFGGCKALEGSSSFAIQHAAMASKHSCHWSGLRKAIVTRFDRGNQETFLVALRSGGALSHVPCQRYRYARRNCIVAAQFDEPLFCSISRRTISLMSFSIVLMSCTISSMSFRNFFMSCTIYLLSRAASL